jgi:hypothetical protein
MRGLQECIPRIMRDRTVLILVFVGILLLFLVFVLVGGKNLNIDYVSFKLDGYNLKVSQRRHVCNRYLRNNILYKFTVCLLAIFHISNFHGPLVMAKLKGIWPPCSFTLTYYRYLHKDAHFSKINRKCINHDRSLYQVSLVLILPRRFI